VAEAERGLVRRAETKAVFDNRRYPAGPDLERWVEHFWTVEWDLDGHPPVDSRVISYPAMHVTAEWGGIHGELRHGIALPATIVHGVVSRVFEVRLTGRGEVVGARFTPGGFAAWTGLDASAYTDRALPAVELLGPELGALHERIGAAGSLERRVDRLREILHARRPATRKASDDDLAALVRRMASDDTLVRVEQLAELTGRSVRTLQRQFRRNVGVGPKWVLARYRLQEAAYALETDPGVDLADLAARLGWYDHAHLTNDFRKMLGETPGQYASLAGG
jgi:AraC-like DNA-binding protein